jgi:hypothetical protein
VDQSAVEVGAIAMGTPGTAREARVYKHRKCGGRTTVSGMALVYMTHIFDHPDRTECEECNDTFPMREFVWDDTGEGLADYYARYAGRFQGKDRFLGSNSVVMTMLALGVLLGGIAGFWIGRGWGRLAMVVSIGLGAMLVGLVGFAAGAAISQHVRRRILGTDDFTALD